MDSLHSLTGLLNEDASPTGAKMNRLGSFLALLGIAVFAIALIIALREAAPEAELVAELAATGKGIDSPAFSWDGQTLAACAGEGVVIWDLKSKQVRATWPHERGSSDLVRVSDRNEDWVITAIGTNVRIWDITAQKVQKELKGHKEWVKKLALSPDNRTLAAGENQGLVKVWDLAAEKELFSIAPTKKGFSPYGLAFTPDSKLLAIAGGNPGSDGIQPFWGELQVWDIENQRLRYRFEDFESHLLYAAFSPDGKTLVAGMWRGPIQFWDVASGKAIRAWRGGMQGVNTVAFSPDGNLLVAAGEQPHPIEFDQDTGEVRIIDASNGKDLQILTTSGAVTGITFSADGRLLAAAGRSRTVMIWDVSAFQAKAAK